MSEPRGAFAFKVISSELVALGRLGKVLGGLVDLGNLLLILLVEPFNEYCT